LLAGATLDGEWFNATAFAIARDREARRKRPRRLSTADFYETYEVTLTPITPWRDLLPDEYRSRVRELCDEIEREGRIARNGKPPLGVRTILETPLDRRSDLPSQPWLAGRRKLICWADPRTHEARDYVDRHWVFQRAFRAAARSYMGGHRDAEFPAEAFLPSLWPRVECHPQLAPD